MKRINVVNRYFLQRKSTLRDLQKNKNFETRTGNYGCFMNLWNAPCTFCILQICRRSQKFCYLYLFLCVIVKMLLDIIFVFCLQKTIHVWRRSYFCIIGWLFDATGSYTSSFLAAGGCFVLSGCINFLVLCTKSSRTARKLKKLKSDPWGDLRILILIHDILYKGSTDHFSTIPIDILTSNLEN
jgi:hypothetical protein